jgi:hypothetical protein
MAIDRRPHTVGIRLAIYVRIHCCLYCVTLLRLEYEQSSPPGRGQLAHRGPVAMLTGQANGSDLRWLALVPSCAHTSAAIAYVQIHEPDGLIGPA